MDLLKICFKACTASDEPEKVQPPPQAVPHNKQQQSSYAGQEVFVWLLVAGHDRRRSWAGAGLRDR